MNTTSSSKCSLFSNRAAFFKCSSVADASEQTSFETTSPRSGSLPPIYGRFRLLKLADGTFCTECLGGFKKKKVSVLPRGTVALRHLPRRHRRLCSHPDNPLPTPSSQAAIDTGENKILHPPAAPHRHDQSISTHTAGNFKGLVTLFWFRDITDLQADTSFASAAGPVLWVL